MIDALTAILCAYVVAIIVTSIRAGSRPRWHPPAAVRPPQMGRARAVACEHGQVVTVTVIPQDGGATVALRRPAGPGMLLTVTRREAEAINIALTSSLE